MKSGRKRQGHQEKGASGRVGSFLFRSRLWWFIDHWKLTPLSRRQSTHIKIAAFCVVIGFSIAFARMVAVVYAEPHEPTGSVINKDIAPSRRDIVDRNGVLLATSVPTRALYVHPHEIVSRESARRIALRLSEIFPDLEFKRTFDKLTSDKTFVWLRHRMSQGQYQAVHDIGEPGLYFKTKEIRIYPNGELAAHVLGSARDGVANAPPSEVVGVSGAERSLDRLLRDQKQQGTPVALTIDSTLQEIARTVLNASLSAFGAKGASSVLINVHSGEVLSLVSVPGFDPNDPERFADTSANPVNPLFNRSVQGIYEFGSVFKIFPVALALETRVEITPKTVVSLEPFRLGRYTIRDHINRQSELTVHEIITKSSNSGVARLALTLGNDDFGRFLETLGLNQPSNIEIYEAKSGRPQFPDRWSDLAVATASYGHGVAVTQLQLAAAYAALVNGGYLVTPTIQLDESSYGSQRSVISEDTSSKVREMLKATVESGTARAARIEGYSLGGKTGTADKPDERGKYSGDKTLTTFASFFPADDPRYVLIVTLDEPSTGDGTRSQRFAGKTAVPVAKEIISRLMPVLGIRPVRPEPEEQLASGK